MGLVLKPWMMPSRTLHLILYAKFQWRAVTTYFISESFLSRFDISFLVD